MGTVYPIIIPTYEPDERFLELLEKLDKAQLGLVIVVNDGSSEKYNFFFEKALALHKVIMLEHDKNMGKGRALKTAFLYCVQNIEEFAGAVTVDSDGQHTIKSICAVLNQLKTTPDSLVLGVRDFEGVGIPAKSQFGNNLTRKVFRTLYKKDITDTQTGLRGIPAEHINQMIAIEGDRFEYETRMLIYSVENGINIVEVSIDTVYDSKENHSTHFRPIVDSVRIYRVFGASVGKFLVSSMLSSLIDLSAFQIFCILLKRSLASSVYVLLATVLARIISALLNYFINYYFVFNSKSKHINSLIKYFVLAVIQMGLSAAGTNALIWAFNLKVELMAKLPVDITLFFVSFQIQKKLVYKGER